MKEKADKTKIKSGEILLADPFLWDENFRRTAILMCEHNDEGSLGFIMNRPMTMRVDELLSDFPEFEGDIYFGGPVQTDTVHYLHTAGDLLDDSVEVVDGIYWGGSYEKLKILVDTQLITANDIRFFVGYSGWSGKQLADEMERGSWVTAPMFPNYLFKADPMKLWKLVMHNKGNAYTVIAQMPETVDWN